MMKSNKERGAVKIAAEKDPKGTARASTANPMRAEVNQARGPRSGNAGTPAKQGDFLAEKSKRGSYMAALADMVSGALERRGQGMKPNQPAVDDKKALTSLKGDFGRAKRGPTRGNK